jgi:two-component system response regulator AtoC
MQVLLIIDAGEELVRELEAAGEPAKLRILHARDVADAAPYLDWGHIDLAICSTAARGLDGFDLVSQLRRSLPGTTILLSSDGAPAQLAAEAVERGAHDLLQRPIDSSAFELVLRRARDRTRSQRQVALLQRDMRRASGEQAIVAASEPMIRVLEQVERLAASAAAALIRGEPGTGREAIARAIHEQSARRDQPFVALPCSGQTEAYLESELFGRSRGDYAGGAPARRGLLSEASGGTLYLEEIAELPRALQSRLLAVVRSGHVSTPDGTRQVPAEIRLLASTQRDLDREVKREHFDGELLDHLSLEVVPVPPLRERRPDLPLLVDDVLARLSVRHGKRVRALSDAALSCVTSYAWPGNLDELKNALERAVILCAGERIEASELPDPIVSAGAEDGSERPGRNDIYALRPVRHAAEATVIRRALRSTGGNRTHAARLLRISQRTLLYKIKDFKIDD